MTLCQLNFTNQERADLHIHSHFSDGAHPPEKLAELAAQKGLSVIALTDHGTVEGIPALIEAAESHGVYVIPGVELNSSEGSFLGYFVDYDNRQFQAFLEKVRRMRMTRIKAILDNLAQLGFPIGFESLCRIAYPGLPTRTTIARVLVERGHFPDHHTAFAYFLGKGAPTYKEAVAPDAEACIRAIQDAGGVAVEAHPHYHHVEKNPAQFDQFYDKMKRLGLAGYEVPPLDVPQYQRVADRVRHAASYYGLVGVQGSDYHGAGITRAEMGSVTMGCDELLPLMERLPDHCLHRELFQVMRWRSKHLTLEEFKASLHPKEVHLEGLLHRELTERIPSRDLPECPGSPLPFVLIEPGGIDHGDMVLRFLQHAGWKIRSNQAVPDYFGLAWDLHGMGEGTAKERSRALIRMNLNYHLYGSKGKESRVVFFEPPCPIDLKTLRVDLQREIGPIRFYRIRYQGYLVNGRATHVHIPENGRLEWECRILASWGMEVPCREAAVAPGADPS